MPNIVLKVPKGSLSDYQNASGWNEFEKIEELDSANIGFTILDAKDTNLPIYNLQGVQMKMNKENLPAGVYIQNGKKIILSR